MTPHRPAYRFVLASASPRRLDLLRSIGLEPEVRPAGIDETPAAGEAPENYVMRVATEKGQAVHSDLIGTTQAAPADHPPCIVLAADTTVTVDERMLGKPADAAEARGMLAALSGRSHRVWTGVWMGRSDATTEACLAVSTVVRFDDLSAERIDAYVASAEPFGKAGAYAIQGRGALLVESIRGSWSNVVGLPLERLPSCLRGIGLDDAAVLDVLAGGRSDEAGRN